MNYKGFIGHVEYDDESKIFHGEVIGTSDVITFQGTTVDEIEQAFKDSIDDYINFCKLEDKEPQKSFSGIVNLRMGSERHKKVAIFAEHYGKSLNEWINEAIEEKISKQA
jgi:predicted HicB family RNase H-like nuclease